MMAADSANVEDLSEPKHEIVGYDDLCSCCLAAGALVNMLHKIEHGGKMENYYDLVRKCYDSQLLSPENPSNKFYICEMCIARLTDSYSFKLQIIEAQKTLQEFFKVQESTQGLPHRKVSDSSDFLSITQAVLKAESSDSDDDGDPFGDDADLSDYKPPPSPPTSKSTKRAKSKENTPQRPKPIQIIIPKSQPTKSKRTSVKTRASPLKQLSTKQPAKQPAKQAVKRPATSSAKQPVAKQSKTSTSKPRVVAQTKAETRAARGSEKAHNEMLNNSMDLEKLQCRICYKIFKYRVNLAYHMNEHFLNYTCERCGKGFATHSRYIHHAATHKVGSFTCNVCDRVFQTRVKYNSHKGTHEKRNKCKYCPERFPSLIRKRLHMRDAHGETNKYPCPHCDANYIMAYYLTRHVKNHHSVRVRQFNCEHCDKEFYDKASLKEHSVVHSNKKDFLCTVCSKAFARKGNLNQHLKIHRDIRNFICVHCGHGFVHKSSLQSHMRQHDKQIRDIQSNILQTILQTTEKAEIKKSGWAVSSARL